MLVLSKKYFSASSPSVFGPYIIGIQSGKHKYLSSPAVFLFAVFAPIDLIFFISEHKYMIKSLLDRCDTSRVFAADHIADLLGESELFLLHDLFIFNNIDRDVVIDESENVQIHEIDRTLDLDDILFAHFIALCVFDDRNAAVQLIEVKIFIDIHASASFYVVENKAFRDTSYIQCIFYHGCFLSVIPEFLPYDQCLMFQHEVLLLLQQPDDY